MGEYAKRKLDGVEIKLGTCEDMYYLRYEDRDKVTKMPNSVDPVADANELRFRLPFPDEDGKQPGEYDEFERGERLYRTSPVKGCGCDDFADDSTARDPGIIQLVHKSGVVVNLPCYHGAKLPEVAKPVQIFWNGRSWFLELQQLRPTPDGVKPIVGCRFCGHKWRYSWGEVWDYIQDQGLRAALRGYRDYEVEHALKTVEALNGRVSQ